MRIYFNTEVVNDEYNNLAISSIWLEPNKDAQFYMDIPSTKNADASEGEYPKHWHFWNIEIPTGGYIKTNGKYISEDEYNGSYENVEDYVRYDVYKEGKLIKTKYE